MAEVRRKVRNEADARKLLDAWRRSGRILRDWCHAEGLNAHSLGWWRMHLGNQGIRMMEVTPAVVPVPQRSARYFIHLDDVCIEVSDDFREDTLTRLLALVESC